MNDQQQNEDDNRLIDEYVLEDRQVALRAMRELTRSGGGIPLGPFPRADQIIFFDNNVNFSSMQIFFPTISKTRVGPVEHTRLGSSSEKKILMYW